MGRHGSSRRSAASPEAKPRAELARRAWPGGPLVVGWTEYVALPDWGIPAVRAKMDTGARSSALHVEEIEAVGPGKVAFDVVLDRRRSHRRKRVTARVRRRSRVRSSNGHYETRLFVATRLRLGPIEREVEFSLVDRSSMIHRVLLGRTALEDVYVDVAHRHLLGRRKKKRAKKKAGPSERAKKKSPPAER
ncbi:MAG TPA: RimK/LysX family protein [Myxococcota bacterium]|nr:RimK/LysX family protein [Myxococcota bacterium]